MILTQVVINCSICCTSTNFTLWRRLQSTQHRLLQHNVRVFVEVEHKKDALFTFTLNVTFFAVVAVHSNCAQASNESRLSPLHRPVTGQSQATRQPTVNYMYSRWHYWNRWLHLPCLEASSYACNRDAWSHRYLEDQSVTVTVTKFHSSANCPQRNHVVL